MASIFLQLLCALLLVHCIFTQADYPPCKIRDILITQEIVGVVHGDIPQFEVTINNTCYCDQDGVLVYCAGFETMEEPDPTIFTMVSTSICLINQGLTIYEGSPLTFRYAWWRPSHFPLITSHVLCP
ncbi:hypothetical protein AMTRI_Chr06g191780 [Amborella trichopoda]